MQVAGDHRYHLFAGKAAPGRSQQNDALCWSAKNENYTSISDLLKALKREEATLKNIMLYEK